MAAIYTLEATFSGKLDGVFYTPEILKSIGRDICRALIPYCGLSVEFPLSPGADTGVDEVVARKKL